MSKFKKKDLVKYFDEMCLFLANHHWTKGDERAIAIREMIQRSGVTEEFVEKWNQVIAERVNVQMKKDFIREEIGLVYPGTENLTQMLEEAGVEVKEKK